MNQRTYLLLELRSLLVVEMPVLQLLLLYKLGTLGVGQLSPEELRLEETEGSGDIGGTCGGGQRSNVTSEERGVLEELGVLLLSPVLKVAEVVDELGLLQTALLSQDCKDREVSVISIIAVVWGHVTHVQ